MKKSRYMIGWILFVVVVTFVGCLCGCSGQRYTKQVIDADGKLVKVIVIDTWCILRNFSSNDSLLIVKDGLYQLKLNHESKSSKVRVVTPYGTVGVNDGKDK